MAESPLESGPVVDTSLKENIAEGYQKLGNVVQEQVTPGVTGDMVYQQRMARAEAITGLAKGIEQGFAPLIDSMASNYKEQQSQSDQTAGYVAGAAAGAGIGTSTPPGAPPAPAGETPAPASQGGGSILTRGLSGDLNILPSFNLFGTGGNSGSATYANTYAKAAVVNAGMVADSDINKLRVKYDGDPEGFKGAADAYINGRDWSILGPAGAGPGRTNAMQTASQTYNGMVLKKGAADLVDSGNVIATQINNVSNDMSALARAGQINSPTFDQKQDQLQDLYGSLGDDPAVDKTKRNLHRELTGKLNGFIGDHIVGEVDAAYQTGGKSAALKALDDGVTQSQI